MSSKHALAFFALCACGTTHRPDAEVTAPPFAREAGTNAGFTMQGVYRCCAQDLGTSCCADTSPGTCFAYGGPSGRCAEAGERIDARATCSVCCAGLERASTAIPGTRDPPALDNLPEGCDESGLDGVFVCIRCGDGECSEGENACNCAKDCPRSP